MFFTHEESANVKGYNAQPFLHWALGRSWPAFGSELRFLITLLLLCGLGAEAQTQIQGQTPELANLSLSAANVLLLQNSRELQAARRAVEAAQAATLTAGARPNPNLSLGVGSINPQVGLGAGGLRDKIVDSSIRIDQLVERGHKLELRVSTARKLQTASAEDLTDTLRQQRLALRSGYYDLMLAQDRLAISVDTAGLYQRSLQAAELRLKAGDIASSDVARIRVDALRAQNDARGAEADRSRAQLVLAYLIGAERRASEIKATDAWPAEQATLAADFNQLIERRADVRAARTRVDAADAARELARSLRTRDLTLGAQFDHYPVNPLYANTSGAGTGNTWGVFVSVPLFTRYYFEGEIQSADVAYNTAVDNLERTRALARADIARARSDVSAAAERLARYRDSMLAEAKKAADSAEFAYKNGAIGVMDLLDARRTLRSIQLDAAAAQADYAKALAAWQAGLDAAQ